MFEKLMSFVEWVFSAISLLMVASLFIGISLMDSQDLRLPLVLCFVPIAYFGVIYFVLCFDTIRTYIIKKFRRVRRIFRRVKRNYSVMREAGRI